MSPPDEPDYELVEKGQRGSSCHINVGPMDSPEGCGDRAIVQDVFDAHLCIEHFEEAVKEEAEEAKLERQLDAADYEASQEYPKGYDGTGSWK